MAYWVHEPGSGSVEPTSLPDNPGEFTTLHTLASGISPGTERLVGLGRVAPADHETMRCAYMEGSFTFPLKYGYALVGANDAGQRYFVMHPHQTAAVVDPGDAVALPDEVPTLRALLFPSLETAQNAVWDAKIADNESVAVIGGGLIGVAVAYVLHKSLGVPIPLIEASLERRNVLTRLPWLEIHSPAQSSACEKISCLFHCSASETGLQWCIDHSGFEARIIEMSWYGDRPVRLDLGSSFHHGRKQIISSQVAHVAAPVRHAVDRAGRTSFVLEHLADAALDQLIDPVRPFAELPALMQEVYRASRTFLLPAVVYPGA